ncbi:MAG: glycosyltransferase family 1 protein [Patescibacteria group bacterium]|jgi:glycosyltransferase involved in cell wall biosynthesis
MKILIDARLYGVKTAKGLGRYLAEVVTGLETQDLANIYTILLYPDNWDEMAETARFKRILAPWRWYSLAEQFYLPGLIRRQKPDLAHFPHFNAPLFYRGPFVVTIHDLILRRHHSRRASTRGAAAFWLKRILYLWTIGSAIRRAKKIITVSQFTKDEILRFYPVAPEKIEVIYNGLAALGGDLGDENSDKNALLRYNINKPFLLCVGNAYPHKNLEKLLAAFREIQKTWDGQLVLVGGSDYFQERLKAGLENFGLNKDSVLFPGQLSDSDLAGLYRAAALYVFPSLYEGFGLPGLEAMSCGLPVACSDIPCFREIYGAAAEYFNPAVVGDITRTIKALLANPARQAELRRLGREQVKKYSWAESVKRHLAVYREVGKRI